jgi:hypothetical protein
MAPRTAKKPAVETVDVQEEATPEDAERIATLSSVLNSGEIEVGAPKDVVPPQLRNDGTVVVRVNSNVEDMSYVGGGRRFGPYNFESGHEYRVPVIIAMELERNGHIWH